MRRVLQDFSPKNQAGPLAGFAIAAMLAGAAGIAFGQTAATPADTTAPATTPAQATAPVAAPAAGDAQAAPAAGAISANPGRAKKKPAKEDKVSQTKDTRAELRKEKKYNPLIGKDADLPDKQLYDKAELQIKRGHYDVGRLDLQTLLNTYPDSQYQMRSKLAIADAWYHEGGSAALAQAEQEYTDFITFFPNAPEASEAQMRVGDIYFKQIDATDRDYSKVVKAEEAYRTMLRTYPDAPPVLLNQAKQDLREVQELLGQREADLGAFYASHQNWAAAVARYQTVVDTYPQFSHMDDVLIGIGDAYSAQARAVRSQADCGPNLAKGQTCLPEGSKARLLQQYEGKAAKEYRLVVLDHAAAPHVEDAKERLIDMGLPVPTPTPQQVAASDALEGSRAQYTMSKRLELLVLRHPDTVVAARQGEPPLQDAPATLAPTLVQEMTRDYQLALLPGALASAQPAAASPDIAAAPADTAAAAPASVPVSNAPLAFQDVPTAGTATSAGDTSTMEAAPASGASGTSVGLEVLTPGVSTHASDAPAATGAPDANLGLKAVAPANSAPLPAPETAATPPDQVNEAAGKPQPAAQAGTPGSKKKPKPAYDKNDESSSKHKPKKGVEKLDPFGKS